MESRIENVQLRSRTATVEEAAFTIKDGMTVAMGGYTSSGYPKVIVHELAKRKEEGEEFKINLITGANVGPIDTILAEVNMVERRAPMIESKALADLVNRGEVCYIEQQMNRMPMLVSNEKFGKIDIVVIEAIRITKEGYVVPSSSVGMIQYFVDAAEMVIIEMNIAQPIELDGLHDIYRDTAYPDRKPIPLTHTNQRIGEPYVKVDPKKIKYIVKSDILDSTFTAVKNKTTSKKIAMNLFNFLEMEFPSNNNRQLPPIQTGFGNLASEIVYAFEDSNFNDIEFFCGGLQEANMELIVKGRVKAASAGSIQMTPKVIEMMKKYPEIIKETLVIRNTDITNNAEVIGRFALIALTSGIEIDIYGNVNSSHIFGTKVVNGIGGGANFVQNAGLSIMLISSENKGGDISTIVPMVPHQDICEHDIDVVITENGVADLRGKGEVERAICIINNCAGSYKHQLSDYLERAIITVGGHHPQILSEAFSWHTRLKETGSMREK